MILILEKYILPNIKADLSNLVESYAYNVYHDDPYRNHVINKYELSKHWNVPFIELKYSSNDAKKIEVIIGTYDFNSVKEGGELIHIDAHTSTLYDYSKCPRHEGPISFYSFGLQSYFLISVDASYQNLGNHQYEKRYNSGFVEIKYEYTNELVSFIFRFKKEDFQFEIISEDLIHRLIKDDTNEYKYRKTNYKKAISRSHNRTVWYDYDEAQSIFKLVDTLKMIDTLVKDGLKIEDIDFGTFGTKYIEGKIVEKFSGYVDYNEFLFSISCSNVCESDDSFVISFNHDLSSKLAQKY